MSAWKAFYEGREGHDYLEYVRNRYSTHIVAIANRIRPHDAVLEIGIGTGTITKALISSLMTHGKKAVYYGIDDDREMVKLARQRLGDDAQIEHGCVLTNVDVLPHSKHEIVHSHGLLEHFSDTEILTIIQNYISARCQIHYVPGMYKEPTFGDERLMPVERWWEIANPDQIITFNGGLDYVLIIENNS